MELSRGVTGFRNVNDPPLPICSWSSFRAHCHEAAHSLGGRVLSTEPPLRGIESNFARTIIHLPAGPIAVLLNAYDPIIAFSDTSSDCNGRLRFLSAPALMDVFGRFGAYRVLDAWELSQPLDAVSCRQLSAVELEQIEYWKPQCLGEVLFNFWD